MWSQTLEILARQEVSQGYGESIAGSYGSRTGGGECGVEGRNTAQQGAPEKKGHQEGRGDQGLPSPEKGGWGLKGCKGCTDVFVSG